MKTAAVALAFCIAHGGEAEHVLPDGARVDCLTETHAWEVDASSDWAQAVGQAAYYAVATGREAGILLLLEEHGCEHLRRLWAALSTLSIPVTVETIGDTCESS